MFKKRNDKIKSDTSKQAVIVEGLFEAGGDFGDRESRQALQNLETQLVANLNGTNAGLDGHDIGEGSFTIYVYGADANQIFEKMSPILKQSPFERLEVTLRYGDAQDDSAQEKRFTL